MRKIFLIFYIPTFNLKAEALGLFTEVCMVCGVLGHTCSRDASQPPPSSSHRTLFGKLEPQVFAIVLL